jgi:hypothetical protein
MVHGLKDFNYGIAILSVGPNVIFTVTGSVTVSGSVTISSGIVTVSQVQGIVTVQQAPATTFNITGSVTVTSGTVTISSGTVTVSQVQGTVTVQQAAGTTFNVTGSVTVSGTVSVSSGTVVVSQVQGTVTVQQAAGTTFNVTGSVTVSGSVTVTSGSIVVTQVQGDVTVVQKSETVFNISGNVNITNAVLNINVTNPALNVGNVPPCLSFDGVDDYVEIPASDSFNVAEAITVMGWIKRAESLPYDATIWRKNSDHFFCVRANSNCPDFDLVIDGAWRFCVSPSPIDTAWHFLAGTYSTADNTMRLYVDGVLVREVTLSGLSSYTIRQTLYAARIGNAFDIRYAKGFIRGVCVYNRALSANEIAHNYNNPNSPITHGLVLWLPFNEGTGTIAYDKSGNNNDGTIYGATWVSSQGSVSSLVNVNLTAQSLSEVKINIAAQTIESVNILAPAAKAVNIAQNIILSAVADMTYLNANGETTIFSVTGRGRLKSLSFVLGDSTAGNDVDFYWIRIYIDGSLKIDLRVRFIDNFIGNGYLTLKVIIPGAAAGWYDNVAPQESGLSRIYWDGAYVEKAAGVLKLETEYTSSFSVRIYNATSSTTAWFRGGALYGGYS